MCGICGFTGAMGSGAAGGQDERPQVLTNMMNRIIHRGPDGAGQYIDDGIAMGFRRLSIIDLKGGDQPMKTADGSRVITFNGEIYNYRELREDLKIKGHTFRTNSDTEVLLHGYTEYGTGILDRLRGMFAFVIWDARKKELFGARDMFGIKPFSLYTARRLRASWNIRDMSARSISRHWSSTCPSSIPCCRKPSSRAYTGCRRVTI